MNNHESGHPYELEMPKHSVAQEAARFFLPAFAATQKAMNERRENSNNNDNFAKLAQVGAVIADIVANAAFILGGQIGVGTRITHQLLAPQIVKTLANRFG